MADGFDLKTHHRDKKGHIVEVTPYKLRIVNGVQRFERPVGSGKWYDAQNNLVEETEPTVKAAAPVVDEEKEALKARIAELEALAKSPKVPEASLKEIVAGAKAESKK